MALENLQAATRIEAILNGDDITPATRREYFLQRAANEVPKPGGNTDAGKIPVVNSGGTGYALEDIPEELPAIASGDAGKVLTVNAGETGVEWAEAGGGGGFFYITASMGAGGITVDKTFAEIIASYEAGAYPVCIMGASYMMADGINDDPDLGYVSFSLFDVGPGGVTQQTLYINSDDTVTSAEGTYPSTP